MSANSEATSSRPRWFCHACHIRFSQPVALQEPECTSCHSTFVEEMTSYNDSAPPFGLWPQPNLASSFVSTQDDSPPIPSTRQRYEQQQQQQQNSQTSNLQPDPQIPFINFVEPLINILSTPSIPNPPDHSSPPSRPPRVQRQSATSAPMYSIIADAIGQGLNEVDPSRFTVVFGPPTPQRHHRTMNSTPSGDQNGQPDQDRFPNEARAPSGAAGNPPQQPFQGMLSLLQSAFGLNPGNNDLNASGQNGSSDESLNSNTPQTDEALPRSNPAPAPFVPEEDSTGVNEDRSPPRQPRPTPRSPRVNVEESHPLRQFINLLNSLSQSDAGITRNGVNEFVINGGTGFGFATQFDIDHNAPFGQNLGDYVTSDSTMQDILNQLINMTGVNASHNPIPASESTIKSLRRFQFDPTLTGNDELIECAICKDTFATDDGCMELPCKHYFHDEDCILPWLKQNGSCPVCRYSLVNDSGSSQSERRNSTDSNHDEGVIEGERSRARAQNERSSMNSNNLNQSSSGSPPPVQPQSSQSANWTDDWEAHEAGPQFDFD